MNLKEMSERMSVALGRMSIDNIFTRNEHSARTAEIVISILGALRVFYGKDRVNLKLELNIDAQQFYAEVIVDGKTRLVGKSATASGAIEELLMGMVVLAVGIEKELPAGKLDAILSMAAGAGVDENTQNKESMN